MPKKRIDWERELEAWLAMKRNNSAATKAEFCRQRGLSLRVTQKKIGHLMVMLWTGVQDVARTKIADEIGLDLATEFREVFKPSKKLYLQTIRKLLENAKGNVAIGATDADEATHMLRVALQGMIDPAKLITGGEPLVAESVEAPDFEWTPSDESKAKKRSRNAG